MVTILSRSPVPLTPSHPALQWGLYVFAGQILGQGALNVLGSPSRLLGHLILITPGLHWHGPSTWGLVEMAHSRKQTPVPSTLGLDQAQAGQGSSATDTPSSSDCPLPAALLCSQSGAQLRPLALSPCPTPVSLPCVSPTALQPHWVPLGSSEDLCSCLHAPLCLLFPHLRSLPRPLCKAGFLACGSQAGREAGERERSPSGRRQREACVSETPIHGEVGVCRERPWAGTGGVAPGQLTEFSLSAALTSKSVKWSVL